MNEQPTIYTIGHSTRPWEDFVTVLLAHQIELLADVRSIPQSRWNPQFGQKRMVAALAEDGIRYEHFPPLGGKLVVANATAPAVKGKPFIGYKAYMDTPAFKEGLEQLKTMALKQRIAYMCAEYDWHKCHRSMISERLKNEGWNVIHILDADTVQEHPNGFGESKQGKLFGE